MTSRLEQLREKLRQQEEAKNTKSFTPNDNALYPFYNMPFNASVSVRFLPDGDDELKFFQEAQKIRIPFSGIKGMSVDKEVFVKVPCMAMYGKTCPITEEIRPWWDDEELKPEARKYYRKQEFLYQGIIRGTSPVEEEHVPENPIRRFSFTKPLHEKINSWRTLFMDGDFDDVPTSFDRGTDFRISKTQNGQYASYDTSSWARKESALTEDERAEIEKYGLWNLSDYLPNEPNEKQLQAIMDMFAASVDGDAFDPDASYAEFYKPWQLNSNNNTTESKPKTTVAVNKPATTTPKVEAKSEPEATTEATPSAPAATTSAAELLARISAKRDNG